MKPTNRAIQSIYKNKVKSLLFFFTFFLLVLFISTLIQTHYAVNRTQQNINNSLNPHALIGWDWTAKQQLNSGFFNQLPFVWPLELNLILEIASLSYVKDYNVYLDRKILSYDLDWYFLPSESEQGCRRSEIGTVFSLRGVTRPNFTEVEEGIFEVAIGRNFTTEEIEKSLPKALISENFAYENQLGIGSVIPLQSVVWNLDVPEDRLLQYGIKEGIRSLVNYYVEIIGLFRICSNNLTCYHVFHLNRIYVPSGFIQKIEYETNYLEETLGLAEHLPYLQSIAWYEMSREEGFQIMLKLSRAAAFSTHVEAFFLLYSAQDMIPFIETVKPMLPEFFTVEFQDNHIHEISKTLNTIERALTGSLYITIGAVLLIVWLISIILLRQRLTEIGLYLSLGEKKINIALQFLLEKIFIIGPAIVSALIVGNVILRLFSKNIILAQLIASIEEERYAPYTFSLIEMFGFDNSNGIDYTFLLYYDTSISIRFALLFSVITVTVILIITTIALSYILRLNPKRILVY